MTDLNNITAQSILEGLQNDVCFVFEARLNNVGSGTAAKEDFNCGLIENCGVDRDANSEIDSQVAFSTDVPYKANVGVEERMRKALQIKYSMGLPYSGEPTQTLGVVSLLLTRNHPIMNIAEREFEGAKFTVKVGGLLNRKLYNEYRMPFDEYPVFLRGRTNGAKRDDFSVNVSISSKERELEVDFPPNDYRGNGGYEGDNEAKGQYKKFIVGKVDNVEPDDLGGGLYQFHDGALNALSELRDNGTALTSKGSSTELLSTSPAAGEYYFDLSRSMVKVGGEPNRITGDVEAIVGGTFTLKASEIIQQLIAKFTPITNFDIAPGMVDYDIGWVFDSRGDLRSAINQLATMLNLMVYVDIDGTLVIRNRNNPVLQAAQIDVPAVNIKPGTFKGGKATNRIWKLKVGYGRNWTDQSGDALPAAVRRQYSKVWKYGVGLNTGVFDSTAFRQIDEQPSPLIHEADADELAGNMVARLGAKGYLYDLTALGMPWRLERGMLANIGDPKTARGVCEILEVVHYGDDNQTKLKVVYVEQ